MDKTLIFEFNNVGSNPIKYIMKGNIQGLILNICTIYIKVQILLFPSCKYGEIGRHVRFKIWFLYKVLVRTQLFVNDRIAKWLTALDCKSNLF